MDQWREGAAVGLAAPVPGADPACPSKPMLTAGTTSRGAVPGDELGDELGGLRRDAAGLRQPDGVVHRGGDRGVAGGAPDHTGWAGALLGAGDQHGVDAASGVPAGAAPDRGVDRLHHGPARAGPAGAGPHDPQPPGRDAGHAAALPWPPPGAPDRGQHGAEAVRPRRVAGGEARQPNQTRMAQAAPWGGC